MDYIKIILYVYYVLHTLYISKMYKILIYLQTHAHFFFSSGLVIKYFSAHSLPQDSYLLLVTTSLAAGQIIYNFEGPGASQYISQTLLYFASWDLSSQDDPV